MMSSSTLKTNVLPFERLRQQSLFLVWGPPSHGPRSRVFARELGIDQLHFIYSTTRRGLLVAPLKYGYQTVKTLALLWRLQPRIVFVQSPPSIAVFIVFLYCLLSNSLYVVDAHSDAFHSRFWSRPVWLHRFLARNAVTTIVTNEHFQQRIRRWGGRAFILRDIPTSFPREGHFAVSDAFNVVVVNTFADDEPLREILDAARQCEKVQFYITGKKSRAAERMPAQVPDNVQFTDFLPDEAYYALLNNSDAVMCLTTRDHTMQRGACEALSMGRPIITSDWPLLKDYFHQGTVHVDNTPDGIQMGIADMAQHHARYQEEINALQKGQMQEWHGKIDLLADLIEQALEEDSRKSNEGMEKDYGTN